MLPHPGSRSLQRVFRSATVRSLGVLLSVGMIGDSFARAAGQRDVAQTPTEIKQVIEKRGVGKPIVVKEHNVKKSVSGNLTAVHVDSFEVTPNGGAAITIQYSDVLEVRNGMSHRQKVWMWVGIGVVIWVTIAIVGAHTI